MRYLNTTTLRQEVTSSANNIIDSDPRVSNWFKPCPDGYFGEWVGDTYTFTLIPEPTQAEIDELAANEYKGLRAEAYPSLTEQADMAYWDRQNGTTTLDDAISAVKLQFPKPKS